MLRPQPDVTHRNALLNTPWNPKKQAGAKKTSLYFNDFQESRGLQTSCLLPIHIREVTGSHHPAGSDPCRNFSASTPITDLRNAPQNPLFLFLWDLTPSKLWGILMQVILGLKPPVPETLRERTSKETKVRGSRSKSPRTPCLTLGRLTRRGVLHFAPKRQAAPQRSAAGVVGPLP